MLFLLSCHPVVDCSIDQKIVFGLDGGYGDHLQYVLDPDGTYKKYDVPLSLIQPEELRCSGKLPACGNRQKSLDDLQEVLNNQVVEDALLHHTLFGKDDRGVDDDVFEIWIGKQYFDIGNLCATCQGRDMPACCPPPEIMALYRMLEEISAQIEADCTE